MFTILPHIGHGGNLAQAVAEAVAVVLQLAVATLWTLNGDEQGRGVAEIVVGHQRKDSLRQTLLIEGESVLDLAPDLIFVVDVIVQVDEHHRHTILGSGSGLGTLHLGISEKETLQRARHLLLYLFGRGAGEDSDDHPLTDGEGRELILRHDVHPIDAYAEENDNDEQGNAIVLEGPGEPAFNLFHGLIDDFGSFAEFLIALGDHARPLGNSSADFHSVTLRGSYCD